ncbi:MAG: hypothetical protein L6R28_13840 [Planctomycetes bacterium]|nr:hypothetical protein [Planctomycetota bacterium]
MTAIARRIVLTVAAAALGAAVLPGCGAKGRRDLPLNVTTVDPHTAPVVSGSRSNIYHLSSCLYARDIPGEELLGYRTPQEAEQTNRSPCAVCKPKERFVAPEEEAKPNE